ncbi:chemotaxis protein CheW [Maricurvus nonylphenolicus]|uniref:chemotaxis protein CheW n=1 Tax=Maricurvus nonylphenolicus TaxID=1008307 RepID=UPI0036F229C1
MQAVGAEAAVEGLAVAESTETSTDDGEQYLTFIMAGEEYGVDILCVQEIRGWESATPIPNAPAKIKGVINLRGTIVPLIDLRQCFGLDAIEYTAVTVVIVLKVATDNGSRIMGIIVDAVSDVYNLSDKDMKTAPDLGDSVNTDYIRGLVSVNEKMVILLEISRLLNMDEIPNLAEVTQQLIESEES